ncbi:peptide-methionine (R)-S-oxide reductase MsrB [Sphingobium phenoxybenzoativorans]|uniref:peptide-methionine (R)-S-oxide reductase MsrB n=1 Tax=Sphingobium phenoxybenzoativorans TaxID=1592790 RepID=UPI0008721D4D|nr:peptide-methionine (R)-S-oxide reductase MsrB [Sphingobium phenoxybenzoativorans]
MISRRELLGSAGLVVLVEALPGLFAGGDEASAANYPVTMTPEQWKKKLTPGQYAVLRQAATEGPGTSPLNGEHRAGTFLCAGCDQRLFSSKTKFDSGTGWPSFWRPLPKAIGTSTDRTLGMARTEVHCARCGGHLGHVFDDGPPPTGLRYCMNGVAMRFAPGA